MVQRRFVVEEVRHVSQNADSACPFLPWCQYKKGHAESAFCDACLGLWWGYRATDKAGVVRKWVWPEGVATEVAV